MIRLGPRFVTNNQGRRTYRSPRIGRLLSWLMLVVLGVMGPQRFASARTSDGPSFVVESASEQLRIGRIELNYQAELAEAAQLLAKQMPRWWSEIERPLAVDVDDSLRVTLVNYAGTVARASQMPHWVAGVARSSEGDIIIARHGPDGRPTDLEQLVKHEMAHVVIHRATGGQPVPRWLHEGLAQSVSTGISFGQAETLASAVFGPGVPDFAELDGRFRGDDGPDAAVAYAAARDFVEFLRGQDVADARTRQLLTELRLRRGLQTAFINAYGTDLTELAARWRGGLFGRFVWWPLISAGGLPGVLLLPLLALAWRRRRRILTQSWARLSWEDELERGHLVGLPVGLRSPRGESPVHA